MVRGKFQVTEIAQVSWNPTIRKVELRAVQDSSTEENARFTRYTPSASISLLIDNPPAAEQLALGKYFHVDFTEVVPEAK
jgi:hypothetical protein